jgi:membrane-associated PAP2 superfamily phosphatase
MRLRACVGNARGWCQIEPWALRFHVFLRLAMSDPALAISASPSQFSAQWREPAALLIGLMFLIGWDLSGWDLLISKSFAGPAGFPLQHAWLTHALLHSGGKIFYGCCALALVVNYYKPIFSRLALDRASQRWWLLTMLISIAAIALLKYVSKSSCPWDLQSFGGVAQHLSHWNFVTPDGGPGRCFPSGHLSGAFSLLAVHFALRPISSLWAQRVLWVVLVMGMVLGLGQVLRGAHFVSHVFYSGWICWTICLASERLRGALARPQPSSG